MLCLTVFSFIKLGRVSFCLWKQLLLFSNDSNDATLRSEITASL